MLTEQQLQEITEALGQEQVERLLAYSVWREQQRYSDDALWARLYELDDREVEILKQLPLFYGLAHSDLPDYLHWRAEWCKLCLELEADKPVKEAYAWHLRQRGDPAIARWLEKRAEYKRVNAPAWQRAAWDANHA